MPGMIFAASDDCGNSGRAVRHNLMAQGAQWCEKVRAYEFGGAIELEPLPTARFRAARQAIHDRVAAAPHGGTQHRLSAAADRETQYASHTYTVSAQGEIVYDKAMTTSSTRTAVPSSATIKTRTTTPNPSA